MSLLRIVRPTIARRSLLASIRYKHTLPDLPYDYAALEPAISGKIMEVSTPPFLLWMGKEKKKGE